MNDNLKTNFLSSVIDKSLKLGATKADAAIITDNSVSVSVRLGKLESLERSESNAIGLRVFCGNKVATISSSDLNDSSIEMMVRRAVDMAQSSPDDSFADIADRELFYKNDTTDINICDSYNVSEAELIEIATKAENSALSNKLISNSEGSSASFSRSSFFLANSSGFNNGYEATSSGFSVSAVASLDGKMEVDHDYSMARYFSDLENPEEIGMSAAEKAAKKLGAKKIKSQNYEIIFDRDVASSILGNFIAAINGDSVVRGTTFLKDSLAKKIFKSNINIYNDPLMPKGLASKQFDAEAVKTKKLALVSNGVLNSWLLDVRSAKKLGMVVNGCAARSIASSPYPSCSNVYLENGSYSLNERISDIKNGVYITETFGMGINLITGDYSQGASGFLIENGKITYPVSEITVAGKLQDMLLNLEPLDDLKLKSKINSPSIYVGKLAVAGS